MSKGSPSILEFHNKAGFVLTAEPGSIQEKVLRENPLQWTEVESAPAPRRSAKAESTEDATASE